jgi:CheY-like chemotaxis protein
MSQFALRGSRVKCECDLPTDLWPADADKGQVGQIVQNLVINGAQAMPEGGVVRIVARNESLPKSTFLPLAPGDYVRISFSDTGVGINPAHLAKVFDPYFTTKKQGSGFGLATVHSILKKHRGHVDVESEVGRGTTFHIWLPALPGKRAGAAVSPVTPPLRFHGRVLIMDDDGAVRQMARQLLVRLGFEVESTGDGAAAVEAYREALSLRRPFVLVVMDLTVPGGMGGREALLEIKKLDPQVRAIVSSGYSSDPVMANYQQHGFRGVVAKPYRLEDFTRVLAEVLQR